MPRTSTDRRHAYKHHHDYRDDSAASSANEADNEGDMTAGTTAADEESLLGHWSGEQVSRAKKHLPAWLVSLGSGVGRWARGPQPPRPYKIEPILPSVQRLPLKLLDRYFPKRKQKVYLLVVHHLFWLLAFVLLLRRSAFSTEVQDYGAPLTLSCEASLW